MAYNASRRRGGQDAARPELDLFGILGNILMDKDMALYESHVRSEAFRSVFSTFMICRYLSMNSNPNVRNIVLNHLTTLESLSEHPELVYRLLLKVVPRTHSRFTSYIKSGFPRAN